MEYGENLMSNERGEVFGLDTGRLIANFSHEAEAASFVKAYNSQQLAEQTSAEPHVWMDESGRHIYAKTEGYFPLYRHPPSVKVLLEALRKVQSNLEKCEVSRDTMQIIREALSSYKPTEG
jgi:hypothetical protein